MGLVPNVNTGPVAKPFSMGEAIRQHGYTTRTPSIPTKPKTPRAQALADRQYNTALERQRNRERAIRQAIRESGKPIPSYLIPTREERAEMSWDYDGRAVDKWSRMRWLEMPIPRRGAKPRNGRKYTWEDDALNLKMREEEDYLTWGRGIAPPDHPGRCKGWSSNTGRPCRAYAARNFDGDYTDFCLRHCLPLHLKFPNGKFVSQVRPGAYLRATAIVTGSSQRGRHGAYSEVIRLQMEEAIRRNDDPDQKLEFQRDIDVANAVNIDDPVAGINDAIRIIMMKIARVNRMLYEGMITEGDHTKGIVLLTEQLRKLQIAKHQIAGSSSGELEDTINSALSDMELDQASGRPFGQVAILPPGSEAAYPGGSGGGDDSEDDDGAMDDDILDGVLGEEVHRNGKAN
jgi:hypothetical protein